MSLNVGKDIFCGMRCEIGCFVTRWAHRCRKEYEEEEGNHVLPDDAKSHLESFSIHHGETLVRML